MSGWNYDMSQAPKGHTEKRTRKGPKGNEYEVEIHVPEQIIACADDGKTVTVSRWLPNEGRWNMFATHETPLAWQPFPKHPEASE